jgi:nitrile hydratase subunit beta
MNGAHDMGGRAGFGPVVQETNEPVFHASWEGRVYGLSGAVGAFEPWNIDEERHGCENQPPLNYVTSSYYATWLMWLERAVVEKDLATQAELASGKSQNGNVTKPLLKPKDVMAAQTSFATYHRETAAKPAFAVGQRVRVRNMMTATHTRLPGYLRGVFGEIVMVHGNHVFPDSNAQGKGENPKWLYAVRFTANAVWGIDTKDLIHADLWEPYLEPA